MALSKENWRRRVEAALTLKGMDLADLRESVHDHGLPKNAAARAGHESDDYQPNHALALVVAELLEMPVAWFEEEDWRSLILGAPQPDVRKMIIDVRSDVADLGIDLARDKDQEQKWRQKGRDAGSEG